jgi:hypothetical protein
MSKKPAERFPDVAAFVAALGGQAVPQIPAGFTGPTPVVNRPRILWDTADTPTVRIPSLRGRRRLVAAGLAAGLLLASGGAWIAFQPSNPANGATPSQRVLADTQHVVATQPVDTPASAARRTPPPVTRPRPAVPAPARAKLSLSTQPTGTLFIDDKPIRSTPILNLEIAPGPHRVQVRRDGFATFDTVFTAEPGQVIKMTRITLKAIGG